MVEQYYIVPIFVTLSFIGVVIWLNTMFIRGGMVGAAIFVDIVAAVQIGIMLPSIIDILNKL